MERKIGFVSIACIFSFLLGRITNSRPGQYFSRGEEDHDGDTSYRMRPQRYAVANFVEGNDQIYGVYSIHQQLVKFNMVRQSFNGTNNNDHGNSEIVHVVIVPSDIDQKYRSVLASWLGEENIRIVDKGYILDRLKDEQQMWKGTFNKLWMYNLTEFDKVIMFE